MEFNPGASHELFDKVKKHLLEQRKKSEVLAGTKSLITSCRYHHPDGLKCSIGCLIDDANYSPHYETMPVWRVDVLGAIERSQNLTLSDLTIEMLRKLQHLHDCYAPEAWEKKLNAVEKEFFGE